jgi:hypothetical protein
MGPSASNAIPALCELLGAEEKDELQASNYSPPNRTSNFFARYSGGSDSYSRDLTDKELAILALARMGKIASLALPTIQQVLAKRRDRVTLGSLDHESTIRDLLMAMMGRIEEQTIPNAERLAKHELTPDDIHLMESTYKTLRLENEMLRRFFGVTHPSVRELDARLKSFRETYDQAIKSRQRPQKKEVEINNNK